MTSQHPGPSHCPRPPGIVRPVTDPFLIEVAPPSSIAVGAVPWGLSQWVPKDQVRRINISADGSATSAAASAAYATAPAASVADATDAALSAAASRTLVIVIRDAHRYPIAQDVVRRLISARPDAIVIEMGLPIWRPLATAYIATFGATRASSRAVGEILGLAKEVSTHESDRL